MIVRANRYTSREQIVDMVDYLILTNSREEAVFFARWFSRQETERGVDFWCAVATILSGESEWDRIARGLPA